jgi:hypothetical protein
LDLDHGVQCYCVTACLDHAAPTFTLHLNTKTVFVDNLSRSSNILSITQHILNLPSITAAAYPASITAAAATPAVMFSSALRSGETSLSDPLLRVADALITERRLLLLNPEMCEARASLRLRSIRCVSAIAMYLWQ